MDDVLEKKLDSMTRYMGRLESRIDELSKANEELQETLAECMAKTFKLEGKVGNVREYCSKLEEDMGFYDGILDTLADLSSRLEVVECDGEQLG